MQPAQSIPPYDPEELKLLIGMRVKVPSKSNPGKIWWVQIDEVLYVSPNSAAAKVSGHHFFGQPRWVGIETLRWPSRKFEPVAIALHKARSLFTKK